MKLRKHAYPIVLLALIYVVGIFGVFTSYYTVYHRLSFKAHVKETREDRQEKLFFTEQAYQAIEWVEEESEFEWQGKMYDVSNISKTRKGYVIVCEHDSFEEMLLAFIDMTKGSKEPQGLKSGNLQPQFFCSACDLTSERFETSTKKLFQNSESLYYSFQPEVSSPPPKFFIL